MAGGPEIAAGGGGGRRRGRSAGSTMGSLNLLTDLAFNLLIFFVVCASTEPEKGRSQQMPSANKEKSNEPKSQNIEIAMTRTTVQVNGVKVEVNDLPREIEKLLKGKERPEDRIVVVRSDKDTPYKFWIAVTSQIEKGGGVITLRLDDEKEVQVR